MTLVNGDGEYTCSCCNNTYMAEWDNEEAIEEYELAFGEFSEETSEIVCDDCYKRMMGDDE